MMEYLIVGAGGAFGSLARFFIGHRIADKSKVGFPIGTLSVNILGALLLGVMLSMKIEGNLYLLACEGFLGAFTTFSTLMYEGFKMIKGKKQINAAIYVFISFFLGIVSFMAGFQVFPTISTYFYHI